MKIKNLVSLLLITVSLASCKVVNTYVVKLSSSPEISSGAYIQLKTTKGSVYLSTPKLSEKVRDMLQSIRPYQCVAITSSEPFNMRNYEVYFTDFKVKKLLEADSKCRAIKVTFNIKIQG